MMDNNSAIRLAVLIDADNASASVVEGLLSEIASLGEATVKRIYGDFTSSQSTQWKDTLNRHAIKPMQQFAYTTGKNATDSALIIDAMDLLHTGRFDGFCLVSSDSDFTGLALRIREEGLRVYGFGEQKTPEAFRNACNKFTFTEVLRKQGKNTPRSNSSIKKSSPRELPHSPAENASLSHEDFPLDLIRTAIENASDDSGWARLSTVGINLTRVKPDFDPRLYGFSSSKLSDLMKSKPDIIEMKGSGPALLVRMKA
ncbi:MAG: NYN domain protein [Lentisphaerae bacterium ADurb.Bin242]|nr:MAG: NYN domain protein [Lentisphaerae bacterium ADurb.Bin242]